MRKTAQDKGSKKKRKGKTRGERARRGTTTKKEKVKRNVRRQEKERDDEGREREGSQRVYRIREDSTGEAAHMKENNGKRREKIKEQKRLKGGRGGEGGRHWEEQCGIKKQPRNETKQKKPKHKKGNSY